MATVGAVWINVLPSMQGFASNLQKQATSAAKVAAVGAGKSMGATMGDATVGAMAHRMTRGVRSMVADSRRMQATFTSSTNVMTRSLGNFTAGWRDAGAAASAFTGRMGTVGQVANRALLAPTRAVGQFAQGFVDSRAAASAFGTRMSAVGGQTRAVLERSLDPLRTFAHGFTDARVAASALSGRMGTLGGVAGDALGRMRDGWHDANAGLSAFSGRMGTIGTLAGRALQPFVEGFRNADAAASIFSGRMGTLGGVARAAVDAAAGGVSRFGEGFSSATVAASAFSGRLGSLGGLVRSALDGGVRSVGMLGTGLSAAGATAVSAFGAMRTGVATAFTGVSTAVGAVATAGSTAASQLGGFFSNAASTAANSIRNVLGGAIGQVSAMLGVIGLGSLGAQVASVASGAQTTQAQIEALYGAAGGGAAEVNALMDGMNERFRGLDMSAMREGAVSLAYMGLQGEEAVGVLERLEKATTVTGSGTVGLQRAMAGLTKGVNAGKFMMGELNQISDAGIPIYDSLADVLGVDIPTAQAMASDGAIGLSDVLDALSGDYGTWFPALLEGADNVGQTFSGAWSTIKNSIVNGFANELTPVIDRAAPMMLGLADKVEAGFAALPGIISRVREAFSGLVDRTGIDRLGTVLMGHVVPAVKDLWTTIQPLATIIGGALVIGVRLLMDGLSKLAPVLSSVAGWLAENRKWVTLVGVAILGGVAAYYALGVASAVIRTITSVTKIWTIAQAAFNAVMAMNPIMLVVIAIGALVAGLIYAYKNFEGFRKVVDTVWQAIKTAAMWIWEKGLKPAFEGIRAGIRWVGDAAMWLWDKAIKPAWDAIVGAFQGAKSGAGGALEWMKGAFQALGDAAMWLWTKAIKPAFDFIWKWIKNIVTAIIVGTLMPMVIAFKAVSAAVQWLWKSVIKPVFAWIGDAALKLWNNAIKPSWDGIVIGIKWLGDWFKKMWTNYIKPAFDLVAAGAMWLWGKIKAAWNLTVAGVKLLANWFKWLWNQIKFAFNWIAAHIKNWWTRTKGLFVFVIAFIKGSLSAAFNWFKDKVIKPVWDWISGHINRIWTGGIKPAFDKIKEGVTAMKVAFEAGKKAIGRAWNGIRDSAKKPVNFLIDTVYNDGIRELWNKVAGVVGADKLGRVSKFATGGSVFGPGTGTSDSIPALLSNGEHVWTAREVSAAGGHSAVEQIRQQALAGGTTYARGGAVGFPNSPRIPSGKRMLDALADFVSPSGLFSAGVDLISGNYKSAIDKVLKPARDITAEIGTKGLPGTPHLLVKKGGSLMKDKISSLVDAYNAAFSDGGGSDTWIGIGSASERLQRAARWADTQHGKPYQWGGGGNPSWDCSGFMAGIENVIRGLRPGRRYTTHSFAGTPPAGWVRNLRSPFTVGVQHGGRGGGHMAGTLLGKNVESGGRGVVTGSMARGTNSFPYRFGFKPVAGDMGRSSTGGGGNNTLYDRGGYIQPGVTLVSNRSGSPEPVLTAGQWRDMHALAQSVGAGEGGGLMRDAHIHLENSEATVQEAFRRLDTELRKRRRGGVHAGRAGR